jgi:hypothetical protein
MLPEGEAYSSTPTKACHQPIPTAQAHNEGLTSTVSASWCVLNMGGGQGTLMTSSLRPWASVVDSRISTLREEHSYCSTQDTHGGQGFSHWVTVTISVDSVHTQPGQTESVYQQDCSEQYTHTRTKFQTCDQGY